ncbi:hypothetical protein [Nocardia carnea]|uniref:hypothetical protein n=1 Tax=Nocardia carnea TaxID=37328 RepID=UPI002454F4C2|nr:hypothetical protein [Nocardia carnea]
MPSYVGHIGKGESLDATKYFEGPWEKFERIELLPDQSRRFTADRLEFSVFVMSGSGTYLFDGRTYELSEGHAVTVGHGSEILVTASSKASLELFVTTLRVHLG